MNNIQAAPGMKKDRRQLSSRFNVNKQNCEIESLPSIKGKFQDTKNLLEFLSRIIAKL